MKERDPYAPKAHSEKKAKSIKKHNVDIHVITSAAAKDTIFANACTDGMVCTRDTREQEVLSILSELANGRIDSDAFFEKPKCKERKRDMVASPPSVAAAEVYMFGNLIHHIVVSLATR